MSLLARSACRVDRGSDAAMRDASGEFSLERETRTAEMTLEATKTIEDCAFERDDVLFTLGYLRARNACARASSGRVPSLSAMRATYSAYRLAARSLSPASSAACAAP